MKCCVSESKRGLNRHSRKMNDSANVGRDVSTSDDDRSKNISHAQLVRRTSAMVPIGSEDPMWRSCDYGLLNCFTLLLLLVVVVVVLLLLLLLVLVVLLLLFVRCCFVVVIFVVVCLVSLLYLQFVYWRFVNFLANTPLSNCNRLWHTHRMWWKQKGYTRL